MPKKNAEYVTEVGQKFNGKVINGVCSLEFSGLAFGSYNVTVSYSGDNYTVGFDNFNVTTLAVKNNLTVGVNVSSE